MSSQEAAARRHQLEQRLLRQLTGELPTGWACRIEDGQLVLRGQHEDQEWTKQLSLEPFFVRVNKEPNQEQAIIQSTMRQIVVAIEGISVRRQIRGQEHAIYPVLRHRSFSKSDRAKTAILRPHTAETVLLYALDYGSGYTLIEQQMAAEGGWSLEQLHTYAMDNLRKLPLKQVRTQQVGPHFIHFISPTDGYAASRVLLTEVLEQYDQQKRGRFLGVAIPHQDVCILADLADESGGQLLARLTYDFASKGPVPITPIPFLYENSELVPYLAVQN